MNVKQIVKLFLEKNGYDGLCNTEVPCGCLNDDLAPCGELYEECQAGHREDVREHDVCDCDGQGTNHWHICVDGPVTKMRKAFAEAEEWICDCGKVCEPMSSEWRWNGRDWEHNHGYPIGHVAAQRTAKQARKE